MRRDMRQGTRQEINALLDPVTNFGKVAVSTGYSSTDLAIGLNIGEGAKLPDPSVNGAFNLIWYNSSDYTDPSDDPFVEIVRVTGKIVDTLTITRAQEGTIATNKNIAGKTYRMILSPTRKTITDIDTEKVSKAGDTMTGVLNLPANGLIVGTNQLVVSGGYVGIGTTVLSRKLDIRGTGETGGSPSDAGNKNATLLLSSTGGGAGQGGSIEFGYGAGTFGQPYFAAIKGLGTNGSGNTTGSLGFFTRNSTTDTSLTERMTIRPDGKIFIDQSLVPANPNGMAKFALDLGEHASWSVPNNTTVQPFGNVNNFSGLIIINDDITGNVGLFLTGLGIMTLVSQVSTGFSITPGTAGRINVYLSSLVVNVENRTGLTISIRIMSFRTRPSQ